MSKSVEHIESSMRRLKRLGWVLSIVFAIILAATIGFAILCTIAAVQQMGMGARFTSFGVLEGDDISLNILPAATWFLIAFFLEVALLGICRDMARGVSPFTVGHARLIAVLGVSFVLNAVVGALFPSGRVLYETIPLGFSYMPNSMVLLVGGQNGVSIDVGSLLTALVCFSISIMWRYAALLQEQTDELV